MAKRMFQMLAAVLAFVAIIGFVKFQQIKTAMAAGKSYQPPPEAVTTVIAQLNDWRATIDAVGSVAAVRGVTLSADLPGVVDHIGFESGSHVASGQVLITLDTRQERAQLAAAEAQAELARANLERSRRLLEQQMIAQADYDQVAALAKQAAANVAEMQATVERKTIRAPFAGVAGIRQVNVGQYVRSGDPIVPLQSVDEVFVDFAVPQQQIAQLHVGDELVVAADSGAAGLARGRITAINPVVDDATRNVQVQATCPNAAGRLRPGMYVTAHVALAEHSRVVALPASAINFAPYGNSVFVVETISGPGGKRYRGVRQQFVQLGTARGDQVAIVRGVQPGQEIVSSGVFKLRTGAAVTINNTVRPGDSSSPRPEDS